MTDEAQVPVVEEKMSFEKEGLQAAIDFTKFLLTLAGGAIAFSIQPAFYGDSLVLKGLGLLSLISLALCVFSGLAVFSVGCVNLANKNYNLEDPRIRDWGRANIFSFAAGLFLLSLLVAGKILSGMGPTH